MKKNNIWLLVLLAIMYTGILTAQDAKIVDLGIFKHPKDHSILKVKLRAAQDVNNGSYSAGIFTVRIPSAYEANLRVEPGSSPYGYAFAGPVGSADGYDYYRFQFSGSVHFVNWERNVQYPVVTLRASGNLPLYAPIELITDNEWTRQHNGDYYQELLGQELERDFYFLPLNVKGFRATPTPKQTVELNWTLENENILAFSEVEYSDNGRDFSSIGRIDATADIDLSDVAYSHMHNDPVDVNYYRIRLTDINGKVTYTPIRVIHFDEADKNFAVFPNPTSGPLTIASRNLSQYSAGVDYQVIDNNGRILWTDRIAAENLNVNLSKLPGGVYFVKIISGSEQLDKFKVILGGE